MADYKKPDHWQLKARKDGFPARSVYKLEEIDQKFSLIKTPGGYARSNFRILDIGAAPGSWSLYVLRKIANTGCDRSFDASGDASGNVSCGVGCFLAAVDLSPLSREFDNCEKNRGLFDSDNFFFLQGDITDPEIRKTLFSKGKYNLIISDAAPGTTGNHMLDSARSLELAETVIGCAEAALLCGGNLVVKIFQGSGTDLLLKRMRTLFKTAKSFKPEACRGESVETYFIGLGLKYLN